MSAVKNNPIHESEFDKQLGEFMNLHEDFLLRNGSTEKLFEARRNLVMMHEQARGDAVDEYLDCLAEKQPYGNNFKFMISDVGFHWSMQDWEHGELVSKDWDHDKKTLHKYVGWKA